MISFKSVSTVAPLQVPPHGLLSAFVVADKGQGACKSIECDGETVTLRLQAGRVLCVPWAQCKGAEVASETPAIEAALAQAAKRVEDPGKLTAGARRELEGAAKQLVANDPGLAERLTAESGQATTEPKKRSPGRPKKGEQ